MVHFIFRSETFKELEDIFSKAEFPAKFNVLYYDIQVKSWLVYYSFQRIIPEIRNHQYVEERIKPQKQELLKILQETPGKGPYNIFFENRRVLFELEVLFFELKSFLDLMATSIGVLLEANCQVSGFKREGKECGAKFLDVLRKNIPDNHKEEAKQLITVFEKHKKEWINDCVRLRDKATHNGTLQTNISMAALNLKPPTDKFTFKYYFDGETDLEIELGKYYLGFLGLLSEVMQIIGSQKA